MRFGSVCSGIEAASVAWHPLGWRAAFLSEIDKFPRAVLAHHYPNVPLHGDFTTIEADEYEPIDLLVGGTPCQDFSVAGLRAGITGDRGNLTLEFLRLAGRLNPRWIVWENVPGVLSSDKGRALGAFLGGLAELGYGFAYRVLDAQFFGLAQRRQRVFVVGYLGDWRRATAVLFERESLSGNPAPSRKAGEGFAPTTAPSLTASGRGVERTRESRGQDPVVVHAPDLARCVATREDGTGRGIPLVPDVYPINTQIATRHNALGEGTGFGIGESGAPAFTLLKNHTHAIAFSSKDHGADAGPISPTLRAMGHAGSHANAGEQVAVAFAQNQRDEVREMDIAGALASEPGMKQQTYLRHAASVRRLTPRECERLQGFPDSYTQVPYRNKPAADGPRYKALGNSMAVPVMAWIGRRIEMVERLSRESEAA